VKWLAAQEPEQSEGQRKYSRRYRGETCYQLSAAEGEANPLRLIGYWYWQ